MVLKEMRTNGQIGKPVTRLLTAVDAEGRLKGKLIPALVSMA